MFNKDSGLVQIWYRQVKMKPELRESVPALSNLREIVFSMLDSDANA